MEGDPALPGQEGGLSTEDWCSLLHAALDNGIRKLKFLGGEPLLRRDLPDIIRSLRARDGEADLSLITSGAAPRKMIDDCFAAGLTRANLSIHGWGPAAFARRGGRARMFEHRGEVLAALLEHGRFIKLNYVYSTAEDVEDLAALLAWAAGQRLVVNVLDDLSRVDLSHHSVIDVVTGLRGQPAHTRVEPDPDSLPTLRLRWFDGLEVEVKDQHLGALAPWRACATCPVRARCREGIHALRLGHTGRLRPCMDRQELGVGLLPALRRGGRGAVAEVWRGYVGRAAA